MGSIPIGISASRGAAILGQCKYSEPVEAWLKICEVITTGFCEANDYPTPEFVDSAATRWGHALEDKICEFAVRDASDAVDISDREKLSVHPEYDYITCHRDGEYVFNSTDRTRTLHEGKTANQRAFKGSWGAPGTDRIPREYMIQVQQQMALTGAEECIVSVLVLPKTQDELPEPRDLSSKEISMIAESLYSMGYFHQYPVKRNQKLIDLMFAEYVRFWNDNVLKKIPPRPQSLDWVKKMIPQPCGTVIASEQVERWSTEIRGIQKEVKNGKKRIEQLKTEILNYMRDQAAMSDVSIDDDSTERINLVAPNGYKLHSFNGKTFR